MDENKRIKLLISKKCILCKHEYKLIDSQFVNNGLLKIYKCNCDTTVEQFITF